MSVNNRNRGFTLIELMVSLVLGLVVIGGVMGVFMSTYQANAQNIKSVRLNEEMRAVMSLMTRDIRRAGARDLAWQPSLLGTDNLFANDVNWVVSRYDSTVPTTSCVLFAYDSNGNDLLDDADRIGYRLRKEGALQSVEMRRNGTACNVAAGWEKVTDENIMNVLDLDFVVTIEPGTTTGVEVRTVIVTLDAATHTRSATPANLTTADCTNIDVVCRRLVEKIRLRNDAVL
jgi:prepilin-type N-terminal cleavage/methylation domain-containing protein